MPAIIRHIYIIGPTVCVCVCARIKQLVLGLMKLVSLHTAYCLLYTCACVSNTYTTWEFYSSSAIIYYVTRTGCEVQLYNMYLV